MLRTVGAGVPWILTGLLALACAAEARAEANLNPEYGDAAYRAFSVFAPTASQPEDYGEDVVVVFHGFMSAVPNGTFKRVFRRLRATHTVIGINYQPLDVRGTVSFLDGVHQRLLKNKCVTTLGTSLGAYWALQFGTRIGAAKVVMLNPVMSPHAQLQRFVGTEQQNIRRQVVYRPTSRALERYRELGVPTPGPSKSLLILTRDDDVLDYRIALDHFREMRGTDLIVYASGGHTVPLKKHPALDVITSFILGQRQPCSP